MLHLVAGIAVVLAVVAHLGTGAVLAGVDAVSPGAVVAALGVGLVTTAASAARWCVVARGLGLPIRFGAALGDCYRAQFLNAVLPGGALGDVHRAVDHGRRVGDGGGAARAVVLERTAGQVVVVVVGSAVVLARPGPVRDVLTGTAGDVLADIGRSAPAAVAVAAVGVALLGLAGVPRLRRGLLALAAGPRAGTRQGLGTLRTGPAVAGLSLVAMTGHVGLLAVAASAVGVRAAPGELVPLLVLSLLAAGLPLNLAGWGPREATAAVAFGAAGLGAGTGLAVSVAFGVLTLVSTLPGLAVLVLRRAQSPSPRNSASKASVMTWRRSSSSWARRSSSTPATTSRPASRSRWPSAVTCSAAVRPRPGSVSRATAPRCSRAVSVDCMLCGVTPARRASSL
ncbi:lysylphosphatidylglycerol synthase domain-containing protein [Actinomycetospora sp. C-140]